jgi:hypothetical protein
LIKSEFVDFSERVVSNSISTLVQLPDPPRNSAHQPPFTFGVEEPKPRFVGRKEELDELKAALTCDTERLWLVTGPGGMAKSQLMKQFVSQVQSENNCVWLLGKSARTLSSSVDLFFRRLHLASYYPEDKSLSDPMQPVIEHIRNCASKRPWIFIIDNVEEQHTEAKKVILALIALSNVKVFVTSRLRHIFGGSSVIVEVKPLSGEDAQSFVNQSLTRFQSPELALDLCVTLQNHPLALSQAVDYIRCEQSSSVNEKYNIQDYLNTFRSQSSKLLKHKVIDENTTVFHTCSISMEIIPKKHGEAGRVAISLLRRLAYFDPDGVPRSVFIRFLNERTFKSKLLFDDGLRLLKSFSLIWMEGEIISVHRLVQHVTRLEIQNLWWPNQYTDQLFVASKLLLLECNESIPVQIPIFDQIIYVFEHIMKDELKIHVGKRHLFDLTPGGIKNALYENNLAGAEIFIAMKLLWLRVLTSKDLGTASCIGTLTKLQQNIEGLSEENEDPDAGRRLAVEFMCAVYENADEWCNIEVYLLYHFYLIRVAELIYKAKHPILYGLLKLNNIFSSKTLVTFLKYIHLYDVFETMSSSLSESGTSIDSIDECDAAGDIATLIWTLRLQQRAIT